MQVYSYITFNGNCREAMTFYKECLGGELTFQTVGESPLSEKMPDKMKDCIVHAQLRKGSFLIMGSDMVSEEGLKKGNSLSIMLNCRSKREINSLYIKLSSGGIDMHPIESSFWGALFGNLTDKFGIQWLFTYNGNSKK